MGFCLDGKKVLSRCQTITDSFEAICDLVPFLAKCLAKTGGGAECFAQSALRTTEPK